MWVLHGLQIVFGELAPRLAPPQSAVSLGITQMFPVPSPWAAGGLLLCVLEQIFTSSLSVLALQECFFWHVCPPSCQDGFSLSPTHSSKEGAASVAARLKCNL